MRHGRQTAMLDGIRGIELGDTMTMISFKTVCLAGLLVLAHSGAYGASSKERALRLNAEINSAADERDASFKDSEKKARQAIREREEKLKTLKYEDPEEVGPYSGSNTTSSDVSSIEGQTTTDENRLPAAQKPEEKEETVTEENKKEEAKPDVSPEASKSLIAEMVDKKSVENELQDYEGFATEEEPVAEAEASEAQEEKTEDPRELKVADEKNLTVQEEPETVEKPVKKSKKEKKALAKKSKDKKSVAKNKKQKSEKKLAKSKKSKKEFKTASSKKKKSMKLAKASSSKKVSRAPASFSEK